MPGDEISSRLVCVSAALLHFVCADATQQKEPNLLAVYSKLRRLVAKHHEQKLTDLIKILPDSHCP